MHLGKIEKGFAKHFPLLSFLDSDKSESSINVQCNFHLVDTTYSIKINFL